MAKTISGRKIISAPSDGIIIGRIPSHTTPGVEYDIYIDVNNTVCCVCAGWINRHSCSHLHEFRAALTLESADAQRAGRVPKDEPISPTAPPLDSTKRGRGGRHGTSIKKR
jgi:hypothetical protein